jgi:hypothetical protein
MHRGQALKLGETFMEPEAAHIEREGENRNRSDAMAGEKESATVDAEAPQHDLESASAPNEDWGRETLPGGEHG